MQQVLSIASQIPIHDSQDAFRGRHAISAIGKALLCCTIVKNVSKEPQKSDASQCRALHGAHIAHFVAVITSQDQKKLRLVNWIFRSVEGGQGRARGDQSARVDCDFRSEVATRTSVTPERPSL